MDRSSDLEARVAALETQVHALTDRVRHSEQDGRPPACWPVARTAT